MKFFCEFIFFFCITSYVQQTQVYKETNQYAKSYQNKIVWPSEQSINVNNLCSNLEFAFAKKR